MIALSVLEYINLFGGCFISIISIALLLRREPSAIRRVSAFLFLCLGYNHILIGVFHPNHAGLVSFVLYSLNIISYFCVGPLLYILIACYIETAYRIRSYPWHLFIPALLACILSFGSLVFTGPVSLLSLLLIAHLPVFCMIWILFLGLFSLVVLGKRLFSSGENRKGPLFFFIALGFILFLSLADVFNRLGDYGYRSLINAVLCLFYIILFFLVARNLSYFNLRPQTADQNHSSRLHGLNIARLSGQLEALMKAEQIFGDSTLTLSSLASRLEVTPHQLSELLNKHYGKNFHQYVNEYRIDEAKRLLLENVNKTVLSICMQVGFDSSSAFYAAFKKQTGCSPNQFRKKSSCNS